MLKSIRQVFHIRRGLKDTENVIHELSFAPIAGFLHTGIFLFSLLSLVFIFLGIEYDIAFLRFLALLFMLMLLLSLVLLFRIKKMMKSIIHKTFPQKLK